MAKTTDTPFSMALLKANRKHHQKNVLVYGKMASQKDSTRWAKIQFKKSTKYLVDIDLAIQKLTKH